MFSPHLSRQHTPAIWVFRAATAASAATAMVVMRWAALAADIIAAVRRAGVEAATHPSLNVVGSSAHTMSGVSRAAVAVIMEAMVAASVAMVVASVAMVVAMVVASVATVVASVAMAAATVVAIIRPLTHPARMEAGTGIDGHVVWIAVNTLPDKAQIGG